MYIWDENVQQLNMAALIKYGCTISIMRHGTMHIQRCGWWHNQPRRFALIPATRTGPSTTHTMVFVFRGLCTVHDGQGQLCFPKRVRDTVRD